MKVVTFLKLIIVVVLFVYGCSKAGTEPVGVWSNVQTPESVEFKADNTGLFVVKGLPSLVFTWKPIKNSQVRVDVNFQGTMRTLIGRVEGDNFILEGSGQKATYSRVNQ